VISIRVVTFNIDRHIVGYIDVMCRREGISRSVAIRSILGLGELQRSQNINQGHREGGGVSKDDRSGDNV